MVRLHDVMMSCDLCVPSCHVVALYLSLSLDRGARAARVSRDGGKQAHNPFWKLRRRRRRTPLFLARVRPSHRQYASRKIRRPPPTAPPQLWGENLTKMIQPNSLQINSYYTHCLSYIHRTYIWLRIVFAGQGEENVGVGIN